MRILIKTKLLEDMNANSLRLRDPSCHASSNGTHFLLVAPLMKCGTTVRHTSKAVIYSNAVLEKEAEGMITRLSDLSVPFSCFYSKEGVTSTLGLLPIVVSHWSKLLFFKCTFKNYMPYRMLNHLCHWLPSAQQGVKGLQHRLPR